MYPRLGLSMLALVALVGCDPAGREVSVDESEPAAPRAVSERLGRAIIAGEEYPFRIRTCAIGGPAGREDFLVVGEGRTGNGDSFAINADGNPRAVAIVLRRQVGMRIPAEVFRSEFRPENVRIDGRTIVGSGQFRDAGSGRTVKGEFSVACG